MVIYRKYRPRNFSEVIGQDHLVKTITYSIKEGRPAHAYLFSGTRGVGKTTVARLIAKAVNCETRLQKNSPKTNTTSNQTSYEPCNQCPSCLAIDRGASVDLLELDAASHRGIEEAKALIESVKYPPVDSLYKVFIIDEVHMLTREAFNSLLKTLEEPPAYVVFILATTEPQKVPQTIVSRCQHFAFKRLTNEQIKKKIKRILAEEGIKMDSKALDFVARGGRGSLRDTESLLEQIISQEKKNISWQTLEEVLGIVDPEAVRDFLEIVLKGNSKKALEFIRKIFDRGKDISQFSAQVVDYLRKIILGKIDKSLLEFHDLGKDEKKDILNLGRNISEKKLLQLSKFFSKAERDIGKYPLIHMAIEIATIEAIEELK